MLAGFVQCQEVLPLRLGQFWLLAFQPPLRLCDRHALAGAHPDQVRLKLGHHSQDVEQQPAYRVSRIVGAAAETEHYPFGCQLIGDVPGIGKGARQPVEFGHHEGIAGPARRHRFTKSRAYPVRSRQSVIDEDLLLLNTQGKESVSLGGQVLVVRRDSGITDLHSSHEDMVAVIPPSPCISSCGSYVHGRAATARDVAAGFLAR